MTLFVSYIFLLFFQMGKPLYSVTFPPRFHKLLILFMFGKPTKITNNLRLSCLPADHKKIYWNFRKGTSAQLSGTYSRKDRRRKRMCVCLEGCCKSCFILLKKISLTFTNFFLLWQEEDATTGEIASPKGLPFDPTIFPLYFYLSSFYWNYQRMMPPPSRV